MKLKRWTLAASLSVLTLLGACSKNTEPPPSAEAQTPTQAVFTFPNLDPEVGYLMVTLDEPNSSLGGLVTQSTTGLHSLSLDLEDETVKLERITGNPIVVLEDVLPGTYHATATGYDEAGGLPLYTVSKTVEVLPGTANSPTAAKGAEVAPIATQRLFLKSTNSTLMTQSMAGGSLRLWHRHNQARLTYNGVAGNSGDEKLKPGSGLSEIVFPVLTVIPVGGVTEVGGGEGYGVNGQWDNGKYKKSIEDDEALELRLTSGLGFTSATLNFRIAKNSRQAVILEAYRGNDLVEEQTIEAVSLRGKAKSDKFPLTFETSVDRLVFRADEDSRFGLRASSFTVAPLTVITPEVVSVTPANDVTAAPSTTIDLEFNTPMDRASVEAAFLLTTDTLPLPDDASFTNPATFDKLKLTSMCEGRWRVRNPNAEAIRFTWNIAGQWETGSGIVPANSDVFFYTVGGSQTVRLYVEGKQQQVKASNPSACGSSTPVKGSFTWQDDQKVSFTPNTLLKSNEAYTIRLIDAASSKDGINLVAPYTSRFNASEIVSAGKATSLRIEPGGGLLTGKGDQLMLTVRAYDSKKHEVRVDGLGLEWLTRDTDVIRIEAVPGEAGKATLTALQDVGSATLFVRSHSTGVQSEAAQYMIAKVRAGVELVSDVHVAFPFVEEPTRNAQGDLNFPHITIPSDGSEALFGTFDGSELAALMDYTAAGKLLYPVVLQSDAPEIGEKLVARGNAPILGRVLKKETRGGYSLLQVELTTPVAIFEQIDISFDFEDLATQGYFSAPGAIPGQISTQSLSTQNVLPRWAGTFNDEFLEDYCKPDNGGRLLKFPEIGDSSFNLRPDGELVFRFDKTRLDDSEYFETGMFRLWIGLEGDYQIKAEVDVEPGVKVGFTCATNPFAITIPVPGPLRAIFDINFENRLGLQGDLSLFVGEETVGFDILMQQAYDVRAGFEYVDGDYNNLTYVDFSPALVQPMVDNKFDGLLDVGKISALGEVKPEYIPSLRLGLGGVLSRTERAFGNYIDNPAVASVTTGIRKLTGSLGYDILKGSLGIAGTVRVENSYVVLDKEDSDSTSKASLVGEFGPDVEPFFNLLKNMGVSKDGTGGKAVVNVSKDLKVNYEPLTQGRILVDGEERSYIVLTNKELEDKNVKVDIETFPNNTDGTETRGEIWMRTPRTELGYDRVGQLTLGSQGSLSDSIAITRDMCEQSKKYGGIEFKLIGFNKMFDLREIPGYLGKITFYCDIQPEYYIDGEAVERDFQFMAELEDGREPVCVRQPLPAELKVTANRNIKIDRVNFDISGVISKLVTSPESEGVWVYKNDRVDFEPGNHKANITVYPERGEPFEFEREFIVNSLCLAEVKVNEQVLEEGTAPLVAIGGDGETCAQIVNDLYVELYANSFTGKLGDAQNWITSAEVALGGQTYSLSKASSSSSLWKVDAKNIELPPGTHRAVVIVKTTDGQTRSFERSFKIQEACPEASIVVNGKQLNDTETKILGIAGDCQILNVPHDVTIEPVVPPTPGVRYWKYEGMGVSSPIPPLGGGASATSATLLTFIGTAQRGVDGAVSATASFSTSQGSGATQETFRGNLKIYDCPKITISTSVGTHTTTQDCKGNFEDDRADISINANLELLKDENGNPLVSGLGVSGAFPLTGEVIETESSISFRGAAEGLQGGIPAWVYDVKAKASLVGGGTLEEATSFSILLVRARKGGCDVEDEPPPPPPPCVGCRGAGSWGDPHLKTFDGVGYSFQAVGEFTLVESLDGSLVVQTRQLAPNPSGRVSLNYAVAAQVGDDQIAVYHGEPVPLWINGKPVNLSDKSYFGLPAGGRIYLSKSDGIHNSNVYNVYWPPSASNQSARLEISVLSSHINIYNFELPSQYRGKIRGLLGNFNDDRSDDIATRERQTFAQPVDFDVLYGEYAESWRVTEETSLFSYVDNESTLTFTDRSFPDRPVSVSTLPPAVRKEAEATCRAAGITDESILEGCTLDVAITADETFAVSAAPALPSAQPLKVEQPVFEDRTLVFTGKVVNALSENTGLSEVEVRITAPGRVLRDECVTRTDTLGNYRCKVTLVNGDPFDATVTALGYGPLSVSELTIASTDLPSLGKTKTYSVTDLQLNPATLQLTGRIVGQKGQAAAEAIVSVRGPVGQAVARTDSSGNYELYLAVPDKDLVGTLNYSVVYEQPLASDEVFATRTFRAESGALINVPNDISLNIEAKPALSYINFFGKVNNVANVDMPLDNLTLVVRAHGGAAQFGELCRTEVGRLGSYNCEPVYLPYVSFLPVTYELFSDDQLVAEVEQTSHPLILHSGTSSPSRLSYNILATPTLLQLDFSVRDQIGSPVKDAVVEVLSPSQVEVTTDQQGSGAVQLYLPFGSSAGDAQYRVRYNGAGQSILLDDQVLSYSVVEGELTTLSASVTLPVTLSARDVTFAGYVVPTWNPDFKLSDYAVIVTSPVFGELCRTIVSPSTTDYACTARVASAEDFDVAYNVSGSWGLYEVTTNVPVEALKSSEPFIQPLETSVAGVELSGTVTDDLGKVLENVKVQISGTHNLLLETASDGSYSTQFIVADPSNPLNLEVSVRYGEHDLTEKATLEIVPTANTLTEVTQDVTFTKRLMQLSGQLVYEDDESQPVANSSVTFYEQDRVCTATTNSTGMFTCPERIYGRGGSLELTYTAVTDSGDTVTLPLSVPLPLAGERGGGGLHLTMPQSGVILYGVIYSESGQPIEGADVKAIAGEQVESLTTDASGAYQFSFKTPEVASMRVELTVEDGLSTQTDSVDIDLSSGGLIEQSHDITVDSYIQFDFDQGALNLSLEANLWVPSDPPLLVNRNNRGQQTSWPFATGALGSWSDSDPSITTIHQRAYEGTYYYAVRNPYSQVLAGSGAQVTIRDRQGTIALVTVPDEGTGDWWYVATVDGAMGEVNVVNALLHSFDTSALEGDALPRIVQLGGAVSEAGQAPFAEYDVDVILAGTSDTPCREFTDADGQYSCAWITSQRGAFDLDITARGDGGTQTFVQSVPADADSATSITQNFAFATTNLWLRGRITDHLGNGIPDLRVVASGDLWNIVVTDAEGFYEVKEVFTDNRQSVDVTLKATKGTTEITRAFTVELTPGAVTEHVKDIEVSVSTLVLRGKVTDENGESFRAPQGYSTDVEIEGDLRETLEVRWDGTYELIHEFIDPPQQLTLDLYPDIYNYSSWYKRTHDRHKDEPRTVSIDLAQTGVTEHTEDFVISRHVLTVKGQVTDSSGNGVPDMYVAPTGDYGSANDLVITDADGFYSFDYDFYGDWREVTFTLVVGDSSLLGSKDTWRRTITVELSPGNMTEHVENFELRNDLPGLAMWAADVPTSGLALGPDGTVYSARHQIVAVSEGGEEKWTADVEAYDVTVAADGTVYGGGGRGTYALDPSSGATRWSADYYYRPVLALGQDDTFYAADDFELSAFDSDGSTKWYVWYEDTLGDTDDLALGSDGTLYIEIDNRLIAYAPGGTELWSRDLEALSLAADSDGTLYVGGRNALYALDTNGDELWSVAVSDRVETIAIAEDATVYVGTENGLHAVSANGIEQWHLPLESDVEALAIGSDGVIYAGSGRTLYALDGAGSELWRFEAGNHITNLAVGSEIVYAGTYDMLYAVNATSDGLAASPWPKSGSDNQNSRRAQP